MNLDDTVIGKIIATLAHIAAIPPRQRTKAESYWQLMAETAFTRLYRKIPLHLHDLDAHINVTLGRLTPVTEAAEPPGGKSDG